MAGHIKRRRRRDGSWSYQARISSPANRHRHAVRTFDRKRDAERWLDRQAGSIQDGTFIDPRTSAMPFRELVATWETTRLVHLAPKTRERYTGIVNNYLLPAFGDLSLGRLTRARIKQWFAGLDLSPGSARKVQVVLSSILSEGVELGLLRENPAARLRLATPPRHDMVILTAAEVRAVAQAIRRPSDRLAVFVAAYTGLRAGEQWALRRRDIDLSGRRLMVTRTLKNAHGVLSFENTTKTDGSRRVVSLSPFLVNMLRVVLDTLPDDPDALVFTAPDGGPVDHNEFVKRAFKPAVQGRKARPARRVRNGHGFRRIPAQAAVPAALQEAKQDVRWHDLRHTCAALLIAAGRHPLEIKTRLGHASITTTMDRYGQLFPSAESALADALEATFNAPDNVEPIDRRDDEDPPAAALAAV